VARRFGALVLRVFIRLTYRSFTSVSSIEGESVRVIGSQYALDRSSEGFDGIEDDLSIHRWS